MGLLRVAYEWAILPLCYVIFFFPPSCSPSDSAFVHGAAPSCAVSVSQERMGLIEKDGGEDDAADFAALEAEIRHVRDDAPDSDDDEGGGTGVKSRHRKRNYVMVDGEWVTDDDDDDDRAVPLPDSESDDDAMDVDDDEDGDDATGNGQDRASR